MKTLFMTPWPVDFNHRFVFKKSQSNKIKFLKMYLFSFLCTQIFTLDCDSEILCSCFMFFRQHNTKR